MRNFARVCGALLCVIPLTTCGTYRAIIGDYASDAPVLQSVTPTQAVSGEEITFKATYCTPAGVPLGQGELEDPFTGAQIDFFWDFGGGCDPNTTTDIEPEVTVRDGIRAPYTCSVTLRGGCLGPDISETYTFTLNVTPLSIAAVTPLTGIAEGFATFSAVVGSGVVTDYAWDFGGAASPGGSNAQNPVVTFNAAQGIYQGRVIVSNAFEAVEFPFTITVLPGSGV
ncbi:PKD domain-containing protein [bacterium]|nr:PKD domain-containing protein [bacterium]